MTILIVDDSLDQRLLLTKFLNKGGFDDIFSKESADEALEFLGVGKDLPPSEVDLILMDLIMPGMNGIDACKILKNDPRLKDIPIMVVTAMSDKNHLKEAFTAGAGDFIIKPPNKIELHARVRSLLKLKKEMDKRKDLNRELEQRVEARTFELKMTNDELLKAKVAAETANSAKSEFLTSMTHELRTPLNGIIASAQLTMSENQEPQIHKYAQTILTSSESLLEIINDILAFSRIDSGGLDLEAKSFDLDTTVNQIVDIYSTRAQKKRISFKLNIDPDTPNALIGDNVKLQKVLGNLIDNAVKFSGPGGEINFTIKNTEKTTPEKASLLFIVKDTGVGIPPEEFKKIFEAFSQLDSSISRKYEGIGIGLCLCKLFVDMMGGRLVVDSTPGKGSSFSFTSAFERQDTEKAFASTRNTPQVIGGTDMETKVEVDATQLAPAMKSLAKALESLDPEDTQQTLETVRQQLGQEVLDDITIHIESYEYDEALAALKEIARIHGVEL